VTRHLRAVPISRMGGFLYREFASRTTHLACLRLVVEFQRGKVTEGANENVGSRVSQACPRVPNFLVNISWIFE